MKNRYHNLMKWYLIGALIVCLLLIPELLIAKKITPNDTDFVNTFAIMGIATLVIYIVISVVKLIQFIKYDNTHREEVLQRKKQ